MRLACSGQQKVAEDKIREVSRDWIVHDFMVKSTDFILSVMGKPLWGFKKKSNIALEIEWKMA